MSRAWVGMPMHPIFRWSQQPILPINLHDYTLYFFPIPCRRHQTHFLPKNCQKKKTRETQLWHRTTIHKTELRNVSLKHPLLSQKKAISKDIGAPIKMLKGAIRLCIFNVYGMMPSLTLRTRVRHASIIWIPIHYIHVLSVNINHALYCSKIIFLLLQITRKELCLQFRERVNT